VLHAAGRDPNASSLGTFMKQSMIAPSSAFAAQTYYGTVNPAVNLQATARIGFAF